MKHLYRDDGVESPSLGACHKSRKSEVQRESVAFHYSLRQPTSPVLDSCQIPNVMTVNLTLLLAGCFKRGARACGLI